jgi:hypothetical protein
LCHPPKYTSEGNLNGQGAAHEEHPASSPFPA